MVETELIIAIYVLVDPITGRVRYVGKAIDPVRRLMRHISNSKNVKYHSSAWIKHLLLQNTVPTMLIIDAAIDDEEAFILERFWIKFYRDAGCDLTNLTDGGEGRGCEQVWTDASRKKLSASRKKLFADKEFKAKYVEIMRSAKHRQVMSTVLLERYKNTEAKEKTSKAGKKRFENPEERKKLADAARSANPKNISEGLVRHWSNPENRKLQSERARKRYENPEERKKLSAAAKLVWKRRKGSNANTDETTVA